MTDRSERLTVALAVGVGAVLGVRAMVRRMRRLELKDRVVLITGGSRGLGLLLAREFGERGARVAVCARNAAELERAKKRMTQERICLWSFACDVSQPEQVAEMIGSVRRDLGQIDVLVNNAGVIEVGPVG